MKRGEPPKEVTIVGYVTPSKWDNEDNVIGISIATDEKDYDVVLNTLGQELFDFVDETVEATGLVREDKPGTCRIKVTGYEVVDESDESGYGGDAEYAFEEEKKKD